MNVHYVRTYISVIHQHLDSTVSKLGSTTSISVIHRPIVIAIALVKRVIDCS